MKLRLNKALRAAVLSCGAAALSCGMAQAAYKWNLEQTGDSGVITADSWNTHSNWNLTEPTTWPAVSEGATDDSDKGPGVPGSDAWDKIVITGASGQTPTLEGWCVNLNIASLTQEDGTVRGSNVNATVKKLQGGCHIEIGKGSTLTLQKGTTDTGNDGLGGLDVTLNGTFNMALFENLGVYATNIAYGDISAASEAGILNMSSTTAGNRRTTTAINLSGNLTDSVISDAVKLHSITLMTYTSDVDLGDLTFNFTATNPYFLNAGSSDLTATEDNVGKYSVVNANGKVTLHYVTGLESMLGTTWTLQEGESANLSEQSLSTASRLVLSVTATEAAEDAASYTIDSNCSLNTLTVIGGAAELNILTGNTFELALTQVSEGASLSYKGGGNLVLHCNASVDDVKAVTGSLTIKSATLSFNKSTADTFTLGASELILQDNATFSMLSNGHTFSQKVTMNGGTVYVVDGSNEFFSFSGGIEVGSGGAKISSQWNKNFDLGDSEVEGSGVEGSGKLTLATTDVSSWGRAAFNLYSSIANGVNVEVSDSVLNIKAGGSFGTGTLKLISNTPADANKVTRVNLETDAALKFAEGSKGVVNVGTHTLTAQLVGDAVEGFRFEGTGTINLSGNGKSLRGSTNEALQSSFTGTINIDTTNGHVGVLGSGQLFKADANGNYASLHFKSGNAGNVFGIASAYTETNALKIGNLTSEHNNIQISGGWDSGNNTDRYLEVHQTLEEATFSGIFATTDNNRNVGLIKTGSGNLMLTGANTSAAKLKVSGGTVTLKDGGTWAGAIEVGSVGTLAYNGGKKSLANVTLNNGATLEVRSGTVTLNKEMSVARTKNGNNANGNIHLGSGGVSGTLKLDTGGSLKYDGLTITGVAGAESSISATGGVELSLFQSSLSASNVSISDEVSGRKINAALTDVAYVNNTEGGAVMQGKAKTFSSLTLAGELKVSTGVTLNGSNNSLHSVIIEGNNNLTIGGTTSAVSTELKNATLTIGNGAAYTTGNEKIAKLNTGTDTTIRGTGIVSVGTVGITYTNALIDVTATNNISTIAAKLSGSKVVNNNTDESSPGVNVSADSLADGTNDVAAEKGNITITDVGEEGVTVQNLTVESGKEVSATAGGGSSTTTPTIKVTGTASLATGSTVSGNMTIADSGTLVISGTDFSSGALVDGTLTANATTVSMAEESKIDVTNVTTTTTYVLATAQNMNFTGNFDATKFYTGTLAAGMTAAVTVQSMQTAPYAIDPTTASQLVLTLTEGPVTLTATAVGTTYDAATKTLNINVAETFDATALSGKNLAVSVDKAAWESIVKAMSVVDGGVYNNAFITLNGEALTDFGTVSFNGYTGTVTKGEYFVAYIPEPTTATLSLLALAALAARRRRRF